MSVLSMTGFGRGEAKSDKTSVVVELSTVNRKQFDCHLTLPREIAPLEAQIQTLLKTGIYRGQVRCSIALKAAADSQTGGLLVDLEKARAQVETLRKAARELGLPDDLTASSLFSLPGALSVDAVEVDPQAFWPVVSEAVSAALVQLREMRLREGKTLADDLLARVAGLSEIHRAIAARAALSPRDFRDKLKARLEKLADGVEADPSLLERELVLFADHTDVSEEMTRLGSHLAQATRLLQGDEPVGRPLDFLCQELLREINTTGSKCSDAEIAQAVVTFKSLLETFREQVQNLE